MLSKCLNPACNETFRYLSEGRIFNLELTTYEEPDRVPSHRVERYWLCRKCAMTMAVVVEDGRVTAQHFPPGVAENQRHRDAREAGSMFLLSFADPVMSHFGK